MIVLNKSALAWGKDSFSQFLKVEIEALEPNSLPLNNK